MGVIAGLDIGGAHVKAARLADGVLSDVVQAPCPLWQGFDLLDGGLRDVAALTADADHVAITMTAELTEIFESRADGAIKLIRHLNDTFVGRARFFMGLKGFGDGHRAGTEADAVGSANFLATALVIARRHPHALLIDFGSTTADIIACDRPQGLSDAERLQTGELVYTGLTRTPVPSVTTRAPLLGTWQTLARDPFANMADVRRILEILPEGADQHGTCDGRSASLDDSLRRFARGFGRDGELRHLAGWKVAASYVREVQLRSIEDGALQVMSRPGLNISGGVVTAGVGAGEAARIAERLGLPSRSFAEVIEAPAPMAGAVTHFAPAVAVALLLADALG